MIICHLTTVHPRDDSRILIKEARTLASLPPLKVVLMVADGKGNAEEQSRVSIHDLGLIKGGRLRRVLIGPWRALIAIRKLRPDIVHFHDPELLPLGMLLKMTGYIVIYDVHEDVPRQIYSKDYIPKIIRYPVALVMAALERFFTYFCNAIVPATSQIAERFPFHKTVVIQNCPIVTELLVPMGIPYNERARSFAYTGVIAKIRGVAEIIRAVEFLKDIASLRLELAGEFSPSCFEDSLRTLPGWSSVTYHGWISRNQLSYLLGGVRAGLVLHHPVPNEIDAQPIKTFEYMSAGLPIIASDFPAWRRIIDGAGCGLLVDPFNPEAIALAMRWILEHPDEANAMGQRGRQAVESTYNWDIEATKLKNLYGKLLSGGKIQKAVRN